MQIFPCSKAFSVLTLLLASHKIPYRAHMHPENNFFLQFIGRRSNQQQQAILPPRIHTISLRERVCKPEAIKKARYFSPIPFPSSFSRLYEKTIALAPTSSSSTRP